ncbi:hypothetical protein [Pelomonas sp. KK5]|uniref:hypothetical protein n=1 Tax=Pelomonas sp. KK5 TaxID=1855730 RepID=UPI00097C321E|nr:hypothetical protein [Pelomonas sp. KK5]
MDSTTSSQKSIDVPAGLRPLATMGVLLERLERLPRAATAAQYRDVVNKVTQLLQQAEPGAGLEAVLSMLPATAELYENLHYAQAGLCREPLEAAAQAEFATREALALISRR